ncbi:MAG: hypothetical protein JW830_08950 [Bacteroidales bacterium]|nr:hypothetical protein [Bacteroidales bacterium]
MENHNVNELSHETSFKIIYEMIESAKAKIGKNYFYYLFWGYLIVATCLLEYFLITVVKYQEHYLVWPVLMPLGALITLFFYLRQKRNNTSKTYIGITMSYFWGGWMISFSVLMLFANLKQEYMVIIPVILAMYGLAAFVSGGVVSFRPLVWGAALAWAAAVVSYFLPYLAQLMVLAGVVAISYIIPGHMLMQLSKNR